MEVSYIKRSLLVFLIALSSISNAQINEQEVGNNTTPFNLSDGSVISSLTTGVKCIDFKSPSLNIAPSNIVNNENIKNVDTYSYVQLFVDNEIGPFVWYKLQVKLKVTPLKFDGTEDLTPIPGLTNNEYTFNVEYNPHKSGGSGAIGTNFTDLDLLKINNRYGVKIQLIPGTLVTTNVTTGLQIATPSNVFIKLGVKSKRYNTLSEQKITNFTEQVTNNNLNIIWPAINGAEEYEVQWTWVDGYRNNSLTGILSPGEINFTEREFELNNTRIFTKNLNYSIPLIYSKGYIIYRVRPIGWTKDATSGKLYKLYGKWSFTDPLMTKLDKWTTIFQVNEFEDNKNWQFQASYAEEGKKKEVVSFFDGSLRNRQTVTTINSDNSTVVGEVIYDAQGRAAIEVLPTPTVGSLMKYYNGFNQNLNGSDYSYKDFDIDLPNSCDVVTGEMKDSSGSSKYYSSNNDFQSTDNNKFIPDAKKFPFSQTEFSSDNTGRISRKSGVGIDHKIGSGHEMTYIYSKPTQKELNNLFGISVGANQFYKKNYVVDPNGQISTSYLDPQGRTIATGLLGAAPTSLVPLESNGLNSEVETDLLDKINENDVDLPTDDNILGSSGNFGVYNDKLSVTKNIVNSGGNTPTPFTFKYRAIPSTPFIANATCSGSAFSRPLNYKLNLKLIDKSCNTIIPDFSSTAEINAPFSLENTVSLNKPYYTISKEISVDDVKLNQYLNEYRNILTDPTSLCYINPIAFNPYVNQPVDCNYTYEQCILDIGEVQNYVFNKIKFIYETDNIVDNENIIMTFNVTTNGTNIVITPDDPRTNLLILQYKEEWQLLKNQCELLNFNSGTGSFPVIDYCQTNKDVLIGDLKFGSQYGSDNIIDPDTNENKFKTSIYNINSELYNVHTNTYTGANYRNPLKKDLTSDNYIAGDYLDSFGNIALVEITVTTNNGIASYDPEIVSPSGLISSGDIHTTKPSNLKNFTDFVTLSEDSWYDSLLPYHPEFYYYLYMQKLCDTKTIVDTKPMNSEMYDNFLRSIDFNKAVELGMIPDGNASNLSILNLDPYFSNNIFLSESVVGKNMMKKAIEIDYDYDNDAKIYNLKETSLVSVICNSITGCSNDSAFEGLSLTTTSTTFGNDIATLQKNQKLFWQVYVSNYIALKEKIKHSFINTYAYTKKTYNGCIGTQPSSILNSLGGHVNKADTYAQGNLNYFNGLMTGTNSLCINTLYNFKTKRFTAIDVSYNSSASPTDAANELIAQTNYEVYTQTGKCPRLQDLEIFFSNFFRYAPLAAGEPDFTGNYLTRELLDDLKGNVVYFPNNIISSLKYNLNLSGNNFAIQFKINGANTGSFTNIKIENNTTGITWNNLGTFWSFEKIKNIQFTGIDPVSALNGNSNLVYNFTAVMQIKIGGNTLEVTITGNTKAKIGNCTIAGIGTNTTGGDVLDPYAATAEGSGGCDKRFKFKNALMVLFNKLIQSNTINTLNSPVTVLPLSPYLCEFFGNNYLTFTKTSTNNYVFKTGSTIVCTLNSSQTTNLTTQQFQSIIYSSELTNLTIHQFRISYSPSSTTQPIVISIPLNQVNFSCCPILLDNACPNDKDCDGILDANDNCVNTPNTDQLDQNNDGIGNVCDETICQNIDNCGDTVSENLFEYYFQQFINSFNGSTPDNQIITNPNAEFFEFIQNPNLYLRFKQLAENNGYVFTMGAFNSYRLQTIGNVIILDLIDSNDLTKYCRINFGDIAFNPIECFILLNSFEIQSEINNPNKICSNYSNGCKIDTSYNFSFLNFQYISGSNVVNSLSNCDFLEEPLILDPNCQLCKEKQAKLMLNTVGNECTTCIPQVVMPRACNDTAYNDYLAKCTAFINSGFTSMTVVPQSVFCGFNYVYSYESYFNYLTKMRAASLLDDSGSSFYVTLQQFSSNYLNQGYNNIINVIDQYVTYATTNVNSTDILNWNDWVNTDFRTANANICPPKAMDFELPVVVYETPPSPCEISFNILQSTYSSEAYNNHINTLLEDFKRDYIKMAMSSLVEELTEKHNSKEYHYTLYYYDQAGNLTQTVPPAGVNKLNLTNAQHQTLNIFRKDYQHGVTPELNIPELITQHTLKTLYKYNSLNQLVWQETPDGGITRFAYDDLGRIIASQNAKQARTIYDNGNFKRMSYTLYDFLGRITEAGEVRYSVVANSTTTDYIISDEGRLTKNNITINQFENDAYKSQVTKTIYDIYPEYETGKFTNELFVNSIDTSNQESAYNSRNRVNGIFYFEEYYGDDLQFDNGIFYNYDVHGNVKEVISYISELKPINCDTNFIVDIETGRTNDCEPHIKHVIYNYDLISGNVNQVVYQPNKIDQFIHKYSYDADNRITNVMTSSDGVIWEKDAQYKYYPHGPLSRLELGNKKIQGLDYVYTLQGWLKSVNGENVTDSNNDFGKDGLSGGVNQKFAKDAFGYSLHYFNNDYKAIGLGLDNGTSSFNPLKYSRDNNNASTLNLYNGNIKQMTTSTKGFSTSFNPISKNNYQYDQLNRLISAKSRSYNGLTNAFTTTDSFSEELAYDANGNIKFLNRSMPQNDTPTAVQTSMDQLQYNYISGTNKLAIVKDNITGNSYANDIKDQFTTLGISAFDPNYDVTHNYIYDEIGQLTQDKSEKLTIEWRVDGKVKSVRKQLTSNTAQLTSFKYDGLGNRISKNVMKYSYIRSRAGEMRTTINDNTTYYSRDAQGNVLATFDHITDLDGFGGIVNNKIVNKEHHIYGSSRLGLENKEIVLTDIGSGTEPILKSSNSKKETNLFDTTNSSNKVNIATQVVNNTDINADFALNVTPTTTATWTGLDNVTNLANISQLSFSTQINPTTVNATVTAGTQYVFNELAQKGIVNEAQNTMLTLSPANTCFTRTVNGDNSISLARATSCTNNNGFIYFRNPTNTANIANFDDGEITYVLNNSNEAKNVTVLFQINQATTSTVVTTGSYGIRSVLSGSVINLHTIVNGTQTATPFISNLTSFPVSIKLIKTGTSFTYSVNNATPVSIGNSVAITATRMVTTQTTAGSKISNLNAIVKNYKTSFVEASVRKVATGFVPSVKITKGTSYIKATIPTTSYTYDHNIITTSLVNSSLSLTFNNDLSTTNFTVNTTLKPFVTPTTTVAGANTNYTTFATTNRIKGTTTNFGFNVCNYNYTYNTTYNKTFTYDEINVGANGAINYNLPLKSTDGTLPVTFSGTPPTTYRVIGSCGNKDQDGDAIYDIYEATATTNISTGITTFTPKDSDGDGIQDHVDVDDDNDQVNTVFEVLNVDGDKNPLTQIVDTDTDAILNYLDKDDDGDGVHTEFEGVNPDNDANPNTGVTLDTDGDSIKNYLDTDDDGDIVLTKFEGTNSDNDGNPLTGLTLNTDADVVHNYLDCDDDGDGILTKHEGVTATVTGSLNTDADTLPNFLDVDDDNDGYATWETTEGGPGKINITVNCSATSSAYTLDEDLDGIMDYLDITHNRDITVGVSSFNGYRSLIGDKNYELSNHLGNVLVVLSDKKLPYFDGSNFTAIANNFEADVISYNDYYPFGMLVPNRIGNSPAYRYGFNGMEKDNELKGEGNSYDFGARMYDPRVGRWFAVDPLAEVSPYESPYAYCSNNPIMFVDPTGMIKELPDDQKLGKGDWHKSDREKNNDVWRNANAHNLQQANGSLEYSTISQRTAFYSWFQSETESKGFETKWAGAAYVIANQMVNMENPLLNWAFSSEVIQFAHDGNKAIFDNVVPKLKKLYNGPVLKDEDAKKWDQNTLTVEQRDIVGPIYKRQTSETLTTLSKMAKQEGIFQLGVLVGNSQKLKFNGNINNWKDRYNHGMNVAVKAWEELKNAPILKFTIPRPIQR